MGAAFGDVVPGGGAVVTIDPLPLEITMRAGDVPCLCGCGKPTRNATGWHSECRAACKCGCGQRTKYAWVPGHHKAINCLRCDKSFKPTGTEGGLCSNCRRQVKAGGPLERNGELIATRKLQAASPVGYRWCSGCRQYRLLRFFKTRASEPKATGETRHYSRCRPCHRKQVHGTAVKRTYGVPPDLYAAIKADQDGKCAICQRATGKARNLAVDHDHRCCPGKTSCGDCVRGLLCSNCNNALGFFHDDPEAFRRAARYLEDPPAQRLVIA